MRSTPGDKKDKEFNFVNDIVEHNATEVARFLFLASQDKKEPHYLRQLLCDSRAIADPFAEDNPVITLTLQEIAEKSVRYHSKNLQKLYDDFFPGTWKEMNERLEALKKAKDDAELILEKIIAYKKNADKQEELARMMGQSSSTIDQQPNAALTNLLYGIAEGDLDYVQYSLTNRTTQEVRYLLMAKGKVADAKGNTLEGTALQIAYQVYELASLPEQKITEKMFDLLYESLDHLQEEFHFNRAFRCLINTYTQFCEIEENQTRAEKPFYLQFNYLPAQIENEDGKHHHLLAEFTDYIHDNELDDFAEAYKDIRFKENDRVVFHLSQLLRKLLDEMATDRLQALSIKNDILNKQADDLNVNAPDYSQQLKLVGKKQIRTLAKISSNSINEEIGFFQNVLKEYFDRANPTPDLRSARPRAKRRRLPFFANMPATCTDPQPARPMAIPPRLPFFEKIPATRKVLDTKKPAVRR